MTSISPDCTYWHVEPDNFLNKQQQSFESGNTKINSTPSHFSFWSFVYAELVGEEVLQAKKRTLNYWSMVA